MSISAYFAHLMALLRQASFLHGRSVRAPTREDADLQGADELAMLSLRKLVVRGANILGQPKYSPVPISWSALCTCMCCKSLQLTAR